MTDWKWFKSSKYPAICDYCKGPIPLTEGRWSSKEGQYRYNACGKCLAPPDLREREGPPPLNQAKTVQPTIDGKAMRIPEPVAVPAPLYAVPVAPKESREDAIERMHAEKMLKFEAIAATLALGIDAHTLWAKSQYDALEKIAERLNAMHATMIARNQLIQEAHK